MSNKYLLVNKEERVAVVTINRPEKLNALNTATVRELHDTMAALEADTDVGCVVLTGAGEKAFVAGADISELNGIDADKARQYAERGQAVFRYIETMKTPVIAAVNGFALGGGCELALSCHIRIAADTARFGLPEINLGLLPGYGGTQRLPRTIGLSNAIYHILTADMISAQRAYEMNLVTEVSEADKLTERAMAIAGKISKQAPVSVKYIMEAIYRGIDTDIEAGLKIEADKFGDICTTDDMTEGTSAFLEKRKPRFTGK